MIYQFHRSRARFVGLVLLAAVTTGATAVVFGVHWASLVALYEALVIGWVVWNWGLEVVFKPTDRVTAQRMMEAARIDSEELVYDLGGGDGRLLIMAAQLYGARGVGVEIDPIRYWTARLWIRISGLQRRVQMLRGNLRDIDLSSADVVLMYLSLDVNSDLRSKFSRELKETARVVSYVYPIVGWEPVEVLPSAQPGEDIYLYHSESWSHAAQR